MKKIERKSDVVKHFVNVKLQKHLVFLNKDKFKKLASLNV